MVKNLLQGKHDELNVTSKNAGEKARPGSTLFWEVEGAEPRGHTGHLAHHRRQVPNKLDKRETEKKKRPANCFLKVYFYAYRQILLSVLIREVSLYNKQQ